MTGGLAAACLATAAFVVAWPARSRHSRRRRLGLAGGARSGGWRHVIHRDAIRGGSELAGHIAARHWWAGAALAGLLGLLGGGPVAAAIAGVYAALGSRALGRRSHQRIRQRARGRALDALGALAADLRAGLPPDLAEAPVMNSPGGGAPATTSALVRSRYGPDASDPLAGRVAAAVSLAESTGAPLADLFDRIETDARTADRAAAAAEAQRAGVRATTWLLAGLPGAGIALGYAIGADPVRVLLNTPMGAACALGALALQLAGLAWSARLARAAVTP